jgi:hypothetical protein
MSRSSACGGRHTTVPCKSASGTMSSDKSSAYSPSAPSSQVGGVELKSRPSQMHLFERSREASDRAPAETYARPCQISRVVGSLQKNHAVPAVRCHAHNSVITKHPGVSRLACRSPVGEPCTSRVRTKEHRAVSVGREKVIDTGFVSRCEMAHWCSVLRSRLPNDGREPTPASDSCEPRISGTKNRRNRRLDRRSG